MKKLIFLIVALSCSGLEAVAIGYPIVNSFNDPNRKESRELSACIFNVSIHVIAGETCRGGSNASVSATPGGGTAPYTYTWSPGGRTGSTVSGLSAGTYTVTIADDKGCSGSAAVTITQPAILSASYSITGGSSCSGDTIANVTATGIGGTSPYTYSWSGGYGTHATVTGLSVGSYTITVHDACGASASNIVRIVRPVALSAGAIVTDNVTCNGGASGQAKALVTGGTSPYTYLWSPAGGTAYTANGLSAGTYTVSVVDINGCSSTARVTITQPVTIFSDRVVSTTSPACHGGTGSATIGVSGGVSPYTYIWTPNVSSSSSATDIAARSYVVEVKDLYGCIASITFSITQPAGMTITPYSLPGHRDCTGSAWVRVSGGVLPYSYLWTGGQTSDTISSQCSGTYCCTITEANGCNDSVCIDIPISTGVENVDAGIEQILVYPNPNRGQFTIELPVVSGQSSVEIYNVLGQEVMSEELRLKSTEINLSAVSAGIYLYRVLNEDGSLIGEGKLVVQK